MSATPPTRKTAIKPAKPRPLTIPRPNGAGALLAGGMPGNTGGKKGRSGRKPEAFRNFLARLRQDPALHDALKRAATDETNRGFASALKVLSDYDDDKPAEKKQIEGKVEVMVRIAREGRRITAG